MQAATASPVGEHDPDGITASIILSRVAESREQEGHRYLTVMNDLVVRRSVDHCHSNQIQLVCNSYSLPDAKCECTP